MLQRVDDIEARIVLLESEVEDTTHALQEASETGDAPLIAELSQKNGHTKTEIDSLFRELETESKELARATERFANKLEELDA